MIYIVMGVSGCGKSLIAEKLAAELALPFFDADDFHSPESVAKMSQGIALTDADREPWLQGLAKQSLLWQQEGGAVLACSALKQKYRDWLASSQPDEVQFVYLKGSFELIESRLSARKNHFMAASLLTSQFNTLEEPQDAIIADISESPEQIVAKILQEIRA
ncbi:gluconokinase [Gayadomonas joobiniege]|uniref:gluconokinase n=1 Tax=Gayadomonas joobiniege TaxID=1234606 RepID=UPI000378C08C|nr:gluconokinase [Gayadomonas joobiniege]